MKPNRILSTLFNPTNLAQYSGQSPAYQKQYIKQVAELSQANPAQAAKIVLKCLTENNEKFEKIKRKYKEVLLDYHRDKETIQELSHQITSFSSLFSSLRDSNQSLTDRMNKTWEENQALHRRNIQLEKQQAALNKEISSIRESLQEATDLQLTQSTENKKIRNQLGDFNGANIKHKKEKKELKRKLKKVNSQLTSSQRQIQTLSAKIKRHTARIAQLALLKKTVSEIKNQEIQQLKRQVKVLQTEMHNMTKKLSRQILQRLYGHAIAHNQPRIIQLKESDSIFAPNIIGNGIPASLPSLTTMIRRLSKIGVQVFVKGFFIHHPETACHDIDLILHCADNERQLVQEVNEIMNEATAFCGLYLSNYEYSQTFMIDCIPVDISVSQKSLEEIMYTTRTVMSASGLRQLTVKGDQIIMHPSLLFCNAQELPIIQNAIAQNKLCLFDDYTKQLQELIQSGSDITRKKKTLCFLAKMFARHTTTSPKSWQLMTALMTACQSLDMFFIAYIKTYLGMFQYNLAGKIKSLRNHHDLWSSALSQLSYPQSQHAGSSAAYRSTRSTQPQLLGSSHQYPPIKSDTRPLMPH